ncbi:MAG: hypothetical protein ACTHKN_13475, partial [Achromobacter mucicolens]
VPLSSGWYSAVFCALYSIFSIFGSLHLGARLEWRRTVSNAKSRARQFERIFGTLQILDDHNE